MSSYSWLIGMESLKQHGRRNFIAGCAIAVGLLAMISVIGYIERTNDYLATAAMYLQQPGQIAIIKKDGLRLRLIDPKRYSLTAHDRSKIEGFLASDSRVTVVAPYLFGSGLVGNGCKSFPFSARGLDINKEKELFDQKAFRSIMPEYRSIASGQELWSSPFQAPLAISVGLLKKLGKTLDNKTPVDEERSVSAISACGSPEANAKNARDSNLQLLTQDYDNRLNAVDGDVANSFSTGMVSADGSSLQMPLALMQDLLRTDKVSYIGVFLKDPSAALSVIADLKKSMAKESVSIDAFAWNDERWNPTYSASANVMLVTETFVGVVVIAVVLLSIMNTLTIGLAEARREIGMLRALGYRPSQISWIFAVESLATSLIATFFGSLLSYGLFAWIKSLAIPQKFPGFTMTTTFQLNPPLWSYFAVAFTLCTLVVVVSMILSRRYAKQPILKLLDRGG